MRRPRKLLIGLTAALLVLQATETEAGWRRWHRWQGWGGRPVAGGFILDLRGPGFYRFHRPRHFRVVQGWSWGRRRMPGVGDLEAPDVMRELRRRGYAHVDGLTRRGQTYVGEATGPGGERMRVTIDAQTGEITGYAPVGPPAAARPRPPAGGWLGGY
jgi:hypothetical protein